MQGLSSMVENDCRYMMLIKSNILSKNDIPMFSFSPYKPINGNYIVGRMMKHDSTSF